MLGSVALLLPLQEGAPGRQQSHHEDHPRLPQLHHDPLQVQWQKVIQLITSDPQPRCVWAIWAWIWERQGVLVPYHALHGHPQGHQDGTVCFDILASTTNSSKRCSGNGTGNTQAAILSCPPLLFFPPQLGPVCTFETVGKVLLVGLCGLTHYTRY